MNIFLETEMVRLLYAMLRISGALIAAPIFSAVGVPLQVRVVLSGAVGAMVLSIYPLNPPADPLALAGLIVVVQEAMIGLALGFILQIAFAAPLLAGEYIANSIGLGFANMVDPQSGHSSATISQFLMIIMTLIFLALNGHLILIDIIVRSYKLMPLGEAWLSRDHMWDIVKFGSYAFTGGLAIALPVGFALFALNLLVGVMTRAAPQLNIFAVGLPLTLITGFLVLAIAFPAMSELMERAADTGLDHVRQFLGG